MANRFEIFLLLLVTGVTASSQLCFAQKGLVQFDKPFYFAGEHLFYNIHFDKMETDSAYIKVKLKLGGETIVEHFNKSAKGLVCGFIKLSHELRSDIYTVQALAYQSEVAQPIIIFDEAISIFGSDDRAQLPTTYARFDTRRNLADVPEELAALQIDFASEQKRVRCNMKWNEDVSGSLSINIRRHRSATKTLNVRPFAHTLANEAIMTALPVVGSRVLKIDDQNRSPLLYACHPTSLQFQLTKVNKSGRFVFEFDELYGNEPIQFVEFFGFPMDISMGIEEPRESSIYMEANDEFIADAYLQFQERKKIFQLFNRGTQTPVFSAQIDTVEINEPDFDFDVQDYAIRGTIVDLIREVGSPLKFRKRKDGYEAKVLYEVGDYKYFFSSPPLFIINGIAVHDVSFVSSLVLQEIKRIRIYSRLETLDRVIGGHKIGGLILIDLMDPLFKIPDEFYLPGGTVAGLQAPLQFPIGYTEGEEVPKIEPLVYWSPANTLDSPGRFEFEFIKPDLKGEYILETIFRSEDGEIKMGSKVFTLK